MLLRCTVYSHDVLQFTIVTLYRAYSRDVSLQYDQDVLHSLQS